MRTGQQLQELCRNGVSTGGGALLLAVSRGRASEGVDFPDALARGVIMVSSNNVPALTSFKNFFGNKI